MNRTALILGIGILAGLLAGVALALVAGTSAELRQAVYGDNTTVALSMAVPDDDTGVSATPTRQNRAPMPGEIDVDLRFYLTDYSNILPWLEDVRSVEIRNNVADNFYRVSEVITMDNLPHLFEDTTSAVTLTMAFVHGEIILMSEEINEPLTNDQISVCLALQQDLRMGREVYLYIGVPQDSDLPFPDDWERLDDRPAEGPDWKSECWEYSEVTIK